MASSGCKGGSGSGCQQRLPCAAQSGNQDAATAWGGGQLVGAACSFGGRGSFLGPIGRQSEARSAADCSASLAHSGPSGFGPGFGNRGSGRQRGKGYGRSRAQQVFDSEIFAKPSEVEVPTEQGRFASTSVLQVSDAVGLASASPLQGPGGRQADGEGFARVQHPLAFPTSGSAAASHGPCRALLLSQAVEIKGFPAVFAGAAGSEDFEGIVPFAGIPMPQPVGSQRALHGDGIGPCQLGIEFLHSGGEPRGRCCPTASSPGDGRHDAREEVILHLGEDLTQDEGVLQFIFEIEGKYEALDVGRHEHCIDIGDGQACLVPCLSFGAKGARVHGTAHNRSRQSARVGCGTAPALLGAPGAHHLPSAVRYELMSLLSGLAAAVYNTVKSKDEMSLEVGLLHRMVVAFGLGYSSFFKEGQILFSGVEMATSCGLSWLY